MASEQPNLRKPCPICGRDAMKVFERPCGLHLYRCERGHSFVFDTLRKQVVDDSTTLFCLVMICSYEKGPRGRHPCRVASDLRHGFGQCCVLTFSLRLASVPTTCFP